MASSSISIFVLAICFALAESSSCPERVHEGVYSFIVNSSSPLGPINLMYVQHDAFRGLPFATTTLHNELNQLTTYTRQDDFRRYNCSEIWGYQTLCETTYNMTQEQRDASNRTAFDRGHVTPANPYRFAEDALSYTFYCVNIAPQDPWTNQNPWVTVETRAQRHFDANAGYVMTGICDREDRFSPTFMGYKVPACYWKLICYKDTTGETQVVGFIGNNTLLRYCAGCDVEAKAQRVIDTTTVRDQQEILNEIGANRFSFLVEAWTGAETFLLENRDETRAPRGTDCWAKMTASQATKDEWNTLMWEEIVRQEWTEEMDLDVIKKMREER